MSAIKLARTLFLATLVAMAGLAAFATPAAAQTVTGQMGIESPSLDNSRIAVDVGEAKLSVKWTYQMNPIGAGGITGTVARSGTIQWSMTDCDRPGVTILGALNQVVTFDNTFAQDGTAEGTSSFTIKVTEDAPGETAITCKINAQMGAINPAQASNVANSPFSVTALYRGILSVSLENSIGEAGPQSPITYNIKVTNLGNSDSSVRFDLTENKAALEDGWQPVVPGAINLESTKKGGTITSQTVPFQLSTPHKNGWNNQETTFQMKITPSSIKETGVTGTEYQVTMLARVRGVYVPGFEPLLMVGAVLGTALLARRLRE